MRILTHTVLPEEDGRMVKGILRGSLQLSYPLLKSLKWRENAILLNGQSVHVNAIVHTGDVVSVALSERAPREDLYCENTAAPNIVYEDEDLLVLNKPAGVAMHSKADDAAAPSLAVMLTGYLGDGKERLCPRPAAPRTALKRAAARVSRRRRRAGHTAARRHRRTHRPRGWLHHPPLRSRGRPCKPHGIRSTANDRTLYAPPPAARDGAHTPAPRPHGLPRPSPCRRLALRYGGQKSHRPPRPALV